MKFKIKQFNNKVKMKFFENYYVFRKKFKIFWERFVEKGHEKMTVMFIPHNEKKIFNFQISKFTISFFMLLFVIILVTSSYAVIRNSAVKREERRLLMTYEDIRSHLIRFEQYSNSIEELVDEIKPIVEELYELTSGSEEVDQYWVLNEPDEAEQRELDKMRSILPGEYFTLRKLDTDLENTTNIIRTVKNFLDERSTVVRYTPSIIPNHGHITSLYGWRRSPFGYGRDFHTGIDIAAARGTKIRATAPGVIVSSGWSGGYGNMVRVKHKYGFETVYGHCVSVAVGTGDTVRRGDVIGYVGMTGNATGNHCHYEVRLGNKDINPYPYMSRVW